MLTIYAGCLAFSFALSLVLSVASLLAYYLDKQAARAGRRRISEKTLLLLGLGGGWPGALLAQRRWRHKSAKASFQSRFRLTIAAHLLANLAVFGGLAWLFATGKVLW